MHSTFHPFSCDKCDKSFKVKAELRSHTKLIHEKSSEHVCQICGKMYWNSSVLRVHKETIHEKKSKDIPVKCDLCDKSMHKFIDIKANKFIYSDKFCKSLLTEFKDYITWKNSKLI